MIPVTITPQAINLFIDGRMRTIDRTHMNYKAVSDIVKQLSLPNIDRPVIIQRLRELVDIPSFVAKLTDGRVKIGDTGVMFDNDPVEGVIADRLVEMLREGFDPRPLARFLQRLKSNPTPRAIDEMYKWLDSGKLPLCADGCFIAFKLVEEDFASGHRNPDGTKFYNRPGTVCQMNREDVDDNPYNHCSSGLHFCSFQYLPEFGINRDGTRVVAVKVAPEDVVAIPTDYNHSKGRAWRYVVLDEVPKEDCEHIFANRPVINSFGAYDNTDDVSDEDTYDGDDDSWFDDDDSWLDDDDEDTLSEDTLSDDACDCEACDLPDEDEVQLSVVTGANQVISDDQCVKTCIDRCEGVDPDCPLKPVDDAACGDTACSDGVDGTELTFTHAGREISAETVKSLVADYGQRGMSKLTGIPRSTIQEWLKKIN